MEIIIHRINSIKKLKTIDKNYGIEIDVRAFGSDLVLSHDPYKKGDKFLDYVENYKHGTLIVNIKESGIEKDVSKILLEKKIKNYFFLDVEFPYLFNAINRDEKNCAIRFSEFESIYTVEKFIGILDWVWIDTVKNLSFDNYSLNILKKFKTCLVCPERWGRPNEINSIKKNLMNKNFKPNCIMTNEKYVKIWNS